MIKKLFLFTLVGIICFSSLFSQQKNNSLVDKRDSFYQEYKHYKDTMTVRTWINMVNLVKHLENIVIIDDSILSNIGVEKEESGLTEAEQKLMETRQTLDQLIIQNNKIKDDKDNAQKRLFSVAVVAGLLLIALIIIIVASVSLRSKYKKLENYFKNTNDELLKIKDAKIFENNEVKSKIEIVEQEKELIENNLQEVKKAFETMKLENDLYSKSTQGIDRETYKELAEEFNVLKSEINNILVEKQDLEKSVKEANLKYNQELEYRKQIENELKSILERFK